VKKTFVFNDEKEKNSYGFIIPTAGISLKRFAKNPMMLDSHNNSTSGVLGKWEDLKKENGLLTGSPVFDSEDEYAAKIEGKVERDFLKSCSMGIRFRHEDLKIISGVLVLVKCELYEVSIVAVPSNENSIRLYAAETGELLNDEEVKTLLLGLTPVIEPVDVSKKLQIELENQKNKNEDMSKIKLTAAAAILLGFTADTELESVELSAKIVALNAAKTAAELKLSARLEADEAAKLEAINLQVDTAVTEGRITADKKEQFVNLGIANGELLTSTLASIPVKVSLAGKIIPVEGGEIKTGEDFQKLSLEAQLAFKAASPEEYKKLFTTKN
jgi:HK97 family phage prohead protease